MLLWKHIPSCSKKDEDDGPIIEEVDEMKVGGGRSRKGSVKISFIEALSILKELVEDEYEELQEEVEDFLEDKKDKEEELERLDDLLGSDFELDYLKLNTVNDYGAFNESPDDFRYLWNNRIA